MKTSIHVLSILACGVILGLSVRAIRGPQQPTGPSPEDVVFSNDNAIADNELSAEDVENNSPSKPPEEEAWLSQFELIERNGETVHSSDLKGAPYVVSFFFSTCPSICIQQNQKLKELQDRFEGQGVRFVAISVDPEVDTPDVLKEYANRFGADEKQWLFLTGDLTYIRRVGAEIFRQPVDKKFHTERFALVDAQGEIEGFYNWPEKKQFEELQKRIAEMLETTES